MYYIIKLLSKYSFILAILSINTLYSQQGWYLKANIGGGIYFKDMNSGIVGNYKTSNGGNSWIEMNGGGLYLSFPNSSTGYGIDGPYLRKTTNFGENWLIRNFPFFIDAVNFPTSNIGYIISWGKRINKTTNGGEIWSYLNFQDSTYIIRDLFFNDSLTGFIVGNKQDTNIVMKTTNGGNNWSTWNYITYNNSFFSTIFFVNLNTGFIGAAYSIFKTTNAGANWYGIMDLPTSNRINSIYFPSTNTGYGVCLYGDIIKTTNSGVNWFKQSSVTADNLTKVFFINDNTGFASSVDFNKLYKTTDGGGPPIGIEPISNNIPSEYKLHQNYPNPFNPETHINFSIPERSYVKIIIYDIQGRIIDELVNLDITPGTYSVNWNASVLSSGVYYYKLQIAMPYGRQADYKLKIVYSETKKMLLIK